MYKIQNLTALALLALLNYQIPSSVAQTSPTAVQSTPTSTTPYTYNPTSEATIPPSYHEYTFLYPLTPSFSTIETSYKDTFNVSWEIIAPYHLPTLTITCWLRTSAGPGFTLLDLSEPAINITSPDTTYALISLEPYRLYNPCQFDLSDTQNKTLTENRGALTGFFNISNTSTSTGHVWSSQTPAPIYTGSGHPNSGNQILGGGSGDGRLACVTMLMAFIISWVAWMM